MTKKARRKTEHAGAKNSDAKTGYYGPRVEAKAESKKARREVDKEVVRDEARAGDGQGGPKETP